MTHWILASNGHPFRDKDAARIKRDLLVAELGEAVQLDVLPHPTGGFAVSVTRPEITQGRAREYEPYRRSPDSLALNDSERSPRDVLLRTLERNDVGRSDPASTPATASADPPRPIPPSQSDAQPSSALPPYPEAFRLSPAVRAFLGLHFQAIVGALLFLQPHLVFVLTGLGMPANATAGALFLAAIAICGALLGLMSLSRFLWAYTANTYVIDGNGVEQVQWYFDKGRLRRRAPRVNFEHLRSADVDQSVLQMLLNVGSVKLAAGATDSYEVVLRHVTSPRALQREFQRRLQHANASSRRERAGNDL